MRGLGVGRLFLTSTLVASLIASLLCGVVRGDDLSAGKSFRIRAAAFAPIGKVYSFGDVSIDGRPIRGEQMIWNGDLIAATAGTSARVLLNSLGQVTLSRGSQVRLATGIAKLTDNITRQVLMASLISGDIAVSLQQHAVAVIEAGGSMLTTTPGAAFRVGIQGNQIIVVTMNGTVKMESSGIQREYIVESVNIELSTGRPIGRGANTFRVPPGGIRTISFQVKGKKTKRPVGRGRRVQVALGKPGVGQIGSQSIVVLTNDFGVATATFTAGPNQDSTSVTATDEESGATWKGTIFVAKPPGVWRARNLLLLGAATAAIVIYKWPRDKGPLQQVPPPVIQ